MLAGIAVSLTAALLTSAAPARADTVSLFKTANMTELWSHTEQYLVDLRRRNSSADHKVDIRLWTDNVTSTGCGLRLRALSNDSYLGSADFPKLEEYICDDEVYKMRTTPPNAVFEERVLIEHPVQVELIADGYVSAHVSRLCVALRGSVAADSASGYRAFCVDSHLLRECKQLTNNWKTIALHPGETIILTGKTRGAEKIIFRDVDSLIVGMERLTRNAFDLDARWAVCNRIDLVQGTVLETSKMLCSAEKQNVRYQMSANFKVPYVTTEVKTENKDPNKCSPIQSVPR